MKIKAVTFDLDDTLWPFPPIGKRVEIKLHDWFCRHAPQTAELFPIDRMRKLRHQVWDENPEHAHDMSALRRLTIERALRESGEDESLAQPAYDVFYAERNKVKFYPEAVDAVKRIAKKFPIASISNGNADLERIGLMPPFRHCISATHVGVAKPDKRVFHAACDLLGVEPQYVLHVGDHIQQDIVGAESAGMQAAWINRLGERWPWGVSPPLVQFTNLKELAKWLDKNH